MRAGPRAARRGDLIDDLTRPTPACRTLPKILEELAAAGLDDDQLRILCALACHRAMTRDDFVRKVGLNLVRRLQIVNHRAHDNLEFYGLASQGVPVWVNRDFAHADLKIAAGMITPRGPFFGGGSKLLKEDSTVVIATASPEGLGYHSLMGPGTQLRLRQLAAQEGKVRWTGILFSPNLHPADASALYGKEIQFCQARADVLALLEARYGASARVCVFPTGAMQ